MEASSYENLMLLAEGPSRLAAARKQDVSEVSLIFRMAPYTDLLKKR